MNPATIVDVLALLVQASSQIMTYSQIVNQAHAEGRTELTAEEKQRIRDALMASEARLQAATE